MNTRTWLIMSLVVCLIGCQGDSSPSSRTKTADDGGFETAPASQRLPKTTKPWDAALGTATVQGVAKFVGERPKRRKLDMQSDSACCRLHTDPVLDEVILINVNGGLKNVYVWIKRGLEGWKFPVPTEPVLLDQTGCTFQPHVLAVRAGQPVKIRNSDPVFHNVHAIPTRNTGFNFSQAQQGMEDARIFKLPETSIQVKCDIHGWMSNYIHVSPHPYFAVTAEDGQFELPNLPPGDYVIEAVHEYLGKQTAKVTVADGETRDIDFSFKER